MDFCYEKAHTLLIFNQILRQFINRHQMKERLIKKPRQYDSEMINDCDLGAKYMHVYNHLYIISKEMPLLWKILCSTQNR